MQNGQTEPIRGTRSCSIRIQHNGTARGEVCFLHSLSTMIKMRENCSELANQTRRDYPKAYRVYAERFDSGILGNFIHFRVIFGT